MVRNEAIPAASALMESVIPEGRNSGKIYRLAQPIIVSVFCDDAIFYCESKPLSILSFGHTQDEARRAFNEDFAMMWDEIALSPDDNLTPDAKVVKDRLLALVSSVVLE